jgi:DNA repair photolyase
MELVSTESNITNFPGADVSKNIENIPTPKYDEILKKSQKLSELSAFKTQFNYEVYRDLEIRFHEKEFRGGITFNTPMKLVNHHSTCQQCLYAFEIDTYGRGCVHDCVYCYAKAQLTVHGYWNNPMPAPVDISEIWKTFYTVFETDKPNKWRHVLEKKVPIRIGSMSDSFMFMDKKYGVTKELLRLLDHYQYPYIIFTRSDLVAHDEYIALMNPDLCSIQMSLSSTDDKMTKLIEPGTPSSKRRLLALQKLSRNGFYTTVRLNPFFPIYADGYFTDPNFDRSNMPDPFHFSSFEMVDEIASYGVPSILVGMVRLSPFSLSAFEKAIGRDLKSFYKDDTKKDAMFSTRKSRDYHYSDAEIRAYYERIHAKCLQNNIQFTTCYIGNGESHFWKDQDLWSNKSDCCHAKGNVKTFVSDSREIKWEDRIKHSNLKCATPVNEHTLHKPLVITESGIKLSEQLYQ